MPPSSVDLDREIVRRQGLRGFVRVAWPLIEPATYVHNWHIEEICDHLEAVSANLLGNLIINIPPGMSKSTLCSVLWPAWNWIEQPWYRYICASYDETLANRDARRHKEIVESNWFKERWEGITVKGQGVGEYYNDKGGMRFSVSVRGSGATGRHAHAIVVDDPHKPLSLNTAGSKEAQTVWEWWSGTVSTRQADPKNFHKVIVMQRLAEDDLCGRVLEEMEKRGGEKYEVLRLPMEYSKKHHCVTSFGYDRRTEEGELLNPKRYGAEQVDKLKKALRATGGERNIAGQLQQDPVAAEGNFFKSAWLKRWGANGLIKAIPPEIETTYLMSWDCTFKGSEAKGTPDYVVGQVWCFWRDFALLVDRVKGQWSFTETLKEFRALCAAWPKAYRKLIEDKANGPAVANVLELEIPGIELVNPEGGKEVRATAVTPLFEAGYVLIPEDDHRNSKGELWVPEYTRELLTFPGAKNDDDVDATTLALREKGKAFNKQAYEAFVDALRVVHVR